MIKKHKITILALNVALVTMGISEKAFSSSLNLVNFNPGSGEQIKFSYQDSQFYQNYFQNNGSLQHDINNNQSQTWQTFRDTFQTPLDINNGDIFIYWSSFFPNSLNRNQDREADKYYIGLEYAENDPVCWNGLGGANSIIKSVNVNGSCDSGYTKQKENASVRMLLYPEGGTVYHRLYEDEGFDPNEPAPPNRLNKPYLNNDKDQKYRLQFSKVDNNQIKVTPYYFTNNLWEVITPRQGLDSFILLDYTDNQELLTFETINIQFRGRSGSGFNTSTDTTSSNYANSIYNRSGINSFFVTQEFNLVNSSLTTTTPEAGTIFSLIGVGFLGTTLRKRRKS
jgi:hypothetical protein